MIGRYKSRVTPKPAEQHRKHPLVARVRVRAKYRYIHRGVHIATVDCTYIYRGVHMVWVRVRI